MVAFLIYFVLPLIVFCGTFSTLSICAPLRRAAATWFTLLMITSAVMAQSPATELHAAVVDLGKLPPEHQQHTRYLTLYNLPPEARAKAFKVVCYTLNALSRQRTLAAPVKVSDTLLRIDTRWYADSAGLEQWEEAWGSLAGNDPYWHIKTEVLYAGKLQTILADGTWVGVNDSSALRSGSGSQGAILRADYFVANASHPPYYYDFAGVKGTEDEWLKSIGLDQKVIDRLHANLGANQKDSGITYKPRRHEFDQGPFGGIYRTEDVEIVDAEHDPLGRPVTVGKVGFKFEAGEWLAVGPNGLLIAALFDAKGKRQDAVPVKIAVDSIAIDQHAADVEVIPMQSCARCHIEGLRPYIDDQTEAFKGGHINLLSYDYETIQRVKDFYLDPKLKRQMEFDRATVAAAVKDCTGWTIEQSADAFSEFVDQYANRPVTYDQLRRDCGIPANVSLGVMYGAHDINILELVEGRTTKRGLYEPAFAEAITLAEHWRNRK